MQQVKLPVLHLPRSSYHEDLIPWYLPPAVKSLHKPESCPLKFLHSVSLPFLLQKTVWKHTLPCQTGIHRYPLPVRSPLHQAGAAHCHPDSVKDVPLRFPVKSAIHRFYTKTVPFRLPGVPLLSALHIFFFFHPSECIPHPFSDIQKYRSYLQRSVSDNGLHNILQLSFSCGIPVDPCGLLLPHHP